MVDVSESVDDDVCCFGVEVKSKINQYFMSVHIEVILDSNNNNKII